MNTEFFYGKVIIMFNELLNIVKYSGLKFYVWEDELVISWPMLNPYVDIFWSHIPFPHDADFYALEWDDDFFQSYLCEWYSLPL